jgi:predicted DNA-binding protein
MAGEKRQRKLYLEATLDKRLDEDAEKFGRRSGAEVGAEIIERYIEFWEETELAKQQVFEQQRQQLGVSQPYASGRATRGEVERVKRDAQAREQKKRSK